MAKFVLHCVIILSTRIAVLIPEKHDRDITADVKEVVEHTVVLVVKFPKARCVGFPTHSVLKYFVTDWQTVISEDDHANFTIHVPVGEQINLQGTIYCGPAQENLHHNISTVGGGMYLIENVMYECIAHSDGFPFSQMAVVLRQVM